MRLAASLWGQRQIKHTWLPFGHDMKATCSEFFIQAHLSLPFF